MYCVILENIHTHPKEGCWNSDGAQKPKFLKESRGLKPTNIPWGVWIFSEYFYHPFFNDLAPVVQRVDNTIHWHG